MYPLLPAKPSTKCRPVPDMGTCAKVEANLVAVPTTPPKSFFPKLASGF